MHDVIDHRSGYRVTDSERRDCFLVLDASGAVALRVYFDFDELNGGYYGRVTHAVNGSGASVTARKFLHRLACNYPFVYGRQKLYPEFGGLGYAFKSY